MAITRLKSWNSNEQLLASDLNNEINNITTQLLPGASQSDVNTGTSTTTSLTPALNLTILGTQQNSTSGTSIDFTSIPSGTRHITISFSGVSTIGTSNIMVQIGDSGGIETTGYLGAVTTVAGATPSTANITSGFGVTNAIAAASILHGAMILTLMNSSTNTWSAISVTSLSNAATTHFASGVKSTSLELNQVRITTVGGTETFDAGTINISYGR